MNNVILLIEDNLEMRENTAEILELAGYDVMTAINGKQGVIKAIKSPPNLIVCDIMMPEMDGYETLYMLSKNQKTRNIPFIFLTAKIERSDWRKGMNMGADDYLTKPYDEMDLLNAVEMRLRRSENLKQEYENNIEGVNRFIHHAKGITELKALSENKSGMHYKRKEILYHEGDFAGGMFFLEKGKVRTYKLNEDAKEFTTGLYKPGEFFGFIPLLKEIEQSDTAVAMEDSVVYRIHKDEFTDLLYNNKEVSQVFIKMLSGSVIEKENELINLAYNTVRKRVADGLLNLQQKYKDESGENFSISIPRDGLASMAGTSTESVIRVLAEFKEDDIIKVKASNITILDTEALERIKF